ncbi:MAG: ATP-binding protein [Acidobacteriota bacterium]|nr:PAS domain-containing protein [Acidobacteriota bacterium]MDQ3418478.1 ATP-binding protein [Acidobacteriota bacterium]
MITAVAEILPQLVWTADAAGSVDYANLQWSEYTGLPSSEVVGAGWAQVLHPDDTERTWAIWREAVRQQTPYEITYRLRRHDGMYRWHLARAARLRAPQDEKPRWFGTCTDIHDQKRFEDSQRLLVESSRVLAASFDLRRTLPTVATMMASWFRGYCLIDLIVGDRLERVAAAHCDPDKQALMEEMRGFSPGDDRRSPLWRIITSRQVEVCNTITEDVIQRGTKSDRHAEVSRALGGTGYIIAPLIAGGRAVGSLMIGATSGEPFEEIDARPVEELGYRMAIAVANARAFTEALEANRLKDEFLAIVSHELRTPLNAMRGWMSLLRAAKLTEEQKVHALDVIDRNIGTQTQLVEDLLDISRIVSGRMRLSVHPVDLESIVNAAIDSVKPAAAAKEIRLKSAIDVPDGWIHGDPDRLQQVLWNLLSNAIKFTPRGGEVDVIVRRAKGQAELIVTDTGQGINQDFLPHVFDRFRQGDGTTTRSFGGLGLGLAIVRHLAELHGGTVTAHSDGEGHGATFTLSLPAGSAAARRVDAPEAASAG